MACIRGRHLLIGCETAIFVYDVISKQSSLLPQKLKIWQLFVSQGKCYGIVEDHQLERLSLQEYDIASNRWIYMCDLPSQVKFSSVTANEEHLCVIGGTTADGQAVNYIQVYNFPLKKWMPSLAMAKCSSCTATISQSVLYIGDHQSRNIESIPLSKRANIPSDPAPPVPFTSMFRLLTIQQQLFCIGEGSNTIYVLYKATTKKRATWKPFIEMPTELFGVDACLIDYHSVGVVGTEDDEEYKRCVLYVLNWK